jgi:predicted HAD superfamily Cof-like phosphohydrolase
MKHWLRFIPDGGTWARRTAFDMEQLFVRQELAEKELAEIKQQIIQANQAVTEEAFHEWSLAEVQAAIEAAALANEELKAVQA